VGARGVSAPETQTPQPSITPVQSLSNLEARAPKEQDDRKVLFKFTQEVGALIETNGLQKGQEFLRAAKLMSVLEDSGFRNERVRYELLLAASAKGNRDAMALLPDAWDDFLGTLGRPMRLDFEGTAAKNPESDEYQLDPAPKCIHAVLKNPAKTEFEAAKTKQNSELQKIVDDDQSVRKNFRSLNRNQLNAMVAEDKKRGARTRQIVEEGELHTAEDFANASLVMQHSEAFSGYELAHELAVCSMLLGDQKFGRWLVAATYDRMLNSVGHDQRFGTQYNSDEGLGRIDEAGICNAERQALGCPTLAEARNKYGRN